MQWNIQSDTITLTTLGLNAVQ